MRRDEFKYIMSNILKPKKSKLKGVGENPNFKFTDHLVNDLFTLLPHILIGKTTLSPTTNISKIGSVVAWKYPEQKKEKTKTNYALKSYITEQPISPSNGLVANISFGKPDYSSMSNELLEKKKEAAALMISSCYARIHDYNNHLALTTLDASTRYIYEQGLVSQQALINTKSNIIQEIQNELDSREVESLYESDDLDLSMPVDMPTEKYTSNKVEDLAYNYKWCTTEEVNKAAPTILDTLLDNIRRYKSYTGGNPSLIQGYILNEEVITDNNRLLEIEKENKYIFSTANSKTIVRVFKVEEDGTLKSKLVLVNGIKMQSQSKSGFITDILPSLVKVKIVGYKNSNNFFSKDGNKKREDLVDFDKASWRLELINVIRDKVKLSTYVLIVENSNKEEIKFVLSDCEFIPSSAEGYNAPIDKTIRLHSTVQIKDSKLNKYKVDNTKNCIGTVISIKTNSSSKKVCNNSNTRKLDIITITLSTGRILNVYASDLKFIENNKNVIKKEEPKAQAQRKNSYNFEAAFQNSIQGSINDYLYFTQSTTTATLYSPNQH